jgi:16S rRNA (guanine527-N7)-methyltransferase
MSEADLLSVLERARTEGALGPGPVAPHVAHARAMASVVEAALGGVPTAVLDLGSGGGLPGLVLALCWPDATVVLLDASARRCRGLRQATDGLGLAPRVQVAEGRGEELGRSGDHRSRYPAVVARAFGPPAVAAEVGSAFVAPGGVLVVSEPPAGEAADRWPAAPLADLGLSLASVVRLTEGTFAVLRRTAPVPDSVPRRTGIPAKRPLW